MKRKIVLTSGKGGVGKTTITLGLGRALANLSQRVVIVDTDLSLCNLDVCCDAEQKVVFDIIDCVNGKCRLKQALIQDRLQPSLYLLAGNIRDMKMVSKTQLNSVTDELAASFDYCLLDCPAGIGDDFEKSVYCATESIIVCTPHLSSIRDANKVASALLDYPLSAKYTVINRVRGDLVVKGKMLSAFEIFSLLPCKPLGVLPESDDINCNISTPETDEYFDVLARNLHFGKNVMLDCESGYRKILQRKRNRGA